MLSGLANKSSATFPANRKKSRSSKIRVKSISTDWRSIVAETQEALKIKRKVSHLLTEVPVHKKVNFPTESSYEGDWNSLGMTKFGRYNFPNGCEYEGGFDDGMFHGEGALVYPMGQKLEGVWDKGILVKYKFSNIDGLDFDDKWSYCIMPDRRFNVSIREGLQPAGREFMTNQQPERPIQKGCYDTGDGYYDPNTKCTIVARDPSDYKEMDEAEKEAKSGENVDVDWISSIMMVSPERQEWITTHCRKSWDEPAGYRPEFYEDWITGRKSELEELEKKFADFKESYSSDFTIDSSVSEMNY